VNAVSLHDTWNVALLGALNLAHMGWWAGLNISPHFVESLYMADMVYFLTDFVWLLALPECVAARVWHTLVAHHSSIITCGFFAFGKPVRLAARVAVLFSSRPWCRPPMEVPQPCPLSAASLAADCASGILTNPAQVLMRQALRCWVVELASWNHIAQRKWDSPWLERINKPLFVVTRLIGWPVTYFAYTRDRSSLPAAEILAQARRSLQATSHATQSSPHTPHYPLPFAFLPTSRFPPPVIPI
jgi:hypothetical protein